MSDLAGLQLFSFTPLSGGAVAPWVQGRGESEAAVVESDPVVGAVEPEPMEEPVADAVGESADEPVTAEAVPVVTPKPKRWRRKRAHEADGTFSPDDPQTPAINEAWQDQGMLG